MSLAVPSAMILAALALPIIVFYILKVRLRRVQVSTNLFWKQIYDEKPPRSIWQYFRHLLSLLAQLLLLVLMVFAVADPYFSWQALKARRIVVVIDNSASMQATDVVPDRFSAAIDSAVQMAEGMRFRDKMAIVLTGARPEVVLGMSDHIPTLKRSLRNIKGSDNPTELDTAIELGKQLIGDHPRGEVVVFSDGCSQSVEETDQEGLADNANPANDGLADATTNQTDDGTKPKVRFQLFGTSASNIGITQFQVRRSLIDMLGYEVLVSVKNASNEPVNCRLEIELSDAPVDVLPLKLKPNEVWSRSLEKTSMEGGLLVAKLTEIESPAAEDIAESSDISETDRGSLAELNSLQVDDTAWALLPTQEVQPVLIVTKGNLFLRMVFEANPLVQVSVTSDFPETWPPDTLIVLHNRVPEQLPTGDVFVVDPSDGCDAWDLGQALENPIVTQLDTSSELMTHVRLDNVLMPEARQLMFKEKTHVLAGALSEDPVYAEVKRASGKCLVLTVNLDRSDLTFRTAFPIMVTNALNWFAGSSGELRESSATGSILKYELDDAIETDENQFSLMSPDGKELQLAGWNKTSDEAATNSRIESTDSNEMSDSPALSLGPFNECGVWSLLANRSETNLTSEDQNNKTTITQFAVNIADQRESDLRPPEFLVAANEADATMGGWFVRPVWYYLIGLASVLFVTEWFLYQRRFIS